MIHLLRNRPVSRLNFLPARLKAGQILASLADTRARPIADPTWTLHSIDIVARERRVFRAPCPKIVRKLFERVGDGNVRATKQNRRKQGNAQLHSSLSDVRRSAITAGFLPGRYIENP